MVPSLFWAGGPAISEECPLLSRNSRSGMEDRGGSRGRMFSSNAGRETHRGPIPLILIPAPVDCRCNLSLSRPTGSAPVLRGRELRGKDRSQGQRQIAGSGAVDIRQRQARRRRHTDTGASSLPVWPRGSRSGLVFDDNLSQRAQRQTAFAEESQRVINH